MSSQAPEALDPSSISMYCGQLAGPGYQRHIGILKGGTPVFIPQETIEGYFASLGTPSQDVSRSVRLLSSPGNPVLLSPQLIVPAATIQPQRERADPRIIINIPGVGEGGQTRTLQFDETELFQALTTAHDSPLYVPRKDTFQTGEAIDERYPVVIGIQILLPYSEMSTLPGAAKNSFRAFSASAVNSTYNAIEMNDLVDTPKGRYYIAVLLDSARQRPEQFNAFLSGLKGLGVHTDKLTAEFDARTDAIQEGLTSRLTNIARGLELDTKTIDGIRTAINKELATDCRDLDEETLFSIIKSLAAYPEEKDV